MLYWGMGTPFEHVILLDTHHYNITRLTAMEEVSYAANLCRVAGFVLKCLGIERK